MKIEVYIVVNNEEPIIPYIMRHYGQFAKVIFLENSSTDNTVKLASSLGAEIRVYDYPDELDDRKLLDMKESCWKESSADWIMIVDADEFIYHPNIIEVLKESKATVIHPTFHNMFTEVFPTTKGQIYDEVNMGTDGDFWLSKMNIFKPKEIKSINYAPGCHFAYPEGNVIIDNNSSIKTLQMRFLSRQYLIDKYQHSKERMSALNINNGWGIQHLWSDEQINKYFDDNIPKLIKIV